MAKIPHLQHFVYDDLDKVATESDVLVVTNREAEFVGLLEKYPGKIIVDLVRAWEKVDYAGNYEGISWGSINVNAKQNEMIEKDMAGTEF